MKDSVKEFIAPYDQRIQSITDALRDIIRQLIPEANELIWDNYNALAMAYSKSEILKDAFCHIAVYPKHVNIGFNRGAELGPYRIKLEGKGKLIRHIKVHDLNTLPEQEVQKIIVDASIHADARDPSIAEKTSPGKQMVMSISEKKRRPSS